MNDSSRTTWWRRLKQLVDAGWNASIRERQRVLWLLPVLVLLSLLFLWQGKPRFERSFTLYSDAVIEAQNENRQQAFSMQTHEPPTSAAGNTVGSSVDSLPARGMKVEKEELFPFDPNTIDLEGLVRLGFSPKQAQVILNYRGAGAVFRRPEDFARCYTVSERKFAELKPYIRIGESYRNFSRQTGRGMSDSLSEQKQSVAGNPVGRDILPVSWADSLSETVGKPSRKETGHVALLELNGADSAALVALRGIGPLSAGRIVRYRERLGGFVRMEQLLEVQGVWEENYRMFSTQIFVDSSKIQKIDINFAAPEELAGHPYLPPRVLDRILKHRQLKGGWSHTGELVEQHILSREQAARLAPYLHFGLRQPNQH